MLKEHKIIRIQPGSIAEELGVEPEDILLSVNGHQIEDVFDYHYFVNEEYLTVLIRKPNGEEWELEIEPSPLQEQTVLLISEPSH